MELTIQVNPVERTVRFREVHALAAGDSCVVTLDGIRGADVPSLRMALYRDAASDSPVASCPSFSPVQGHPNLATGTLRLDTVEMAAWFEAVRPESTQEGSSSSQVRSRPEDVAERAVRTDGWLVVSEPARTWAACRVPVILRPGAGTSGVVDPTSLTALVEGLVSAAMSGTLESKADKVAGATAGNLAALGANGNLTDSGKKPADFADAMEFAAHRDDTDIHVTAAQKTAWNAKYAKPQGGIPKADLAAAVQTSLGKADTAIQSHQSLDAYVNAAGYDSDAKEIQLKHNSTVVARINATAFIKDGMVDSVEISGGNLVISFNTDAGVEDIEIPLTDIFNPANYYDKTAADGRFVQKEAGKGLFSGSYNDLTDKPTIPAPVSVDPTLTQPGAAADAKAVGDALKSGFTPWTFGGAAVPGVTYTVDITEYEGPVYIASLNGSDGASETVPVDSPDVTEVTFTLYGVTATRHRVGPTRTSQLVNDSGFVTQQDIAGKADVADLRYRLVQTQVHGVRLPASAFPVEYLKAGVTTTVEADEAWRLSFIEGASGWSLDCDTGVSQDTIAYFDSNGEITGTGDLTSLTFGGSESTILELPGADLSDRASNRVTSADASALTLTLPPAVPGYMRDLIVRIDLTELATAPEVTFAAPTGETVMFETEDGAMPELEAGKVNLVSLTETAAGVIDVAHKVMQEVA